MATNVALERKGRKKIVATAIVVNFIFLIFSILAMIELYRVFYCGELQSLNSSDFRSTIISLFIRSAIWQFSGMVGVILLAIPIDGMHYRKKWLFWILMLLGIGWISCFPVGTFIGLSLLVYTFWKRNTFE